MYIEKKLDLVRVMTLWMDVDGKGKGFLHIDYKLNKFTFER